MRKSKLTGSIFLMLCVQSLLLEADGVKLNRIHGEHTKIKGSIHQIEYLPDWERFVFAVSADKGSRIYFAEKDGTIITRPVYYDPYLELWSGASSYFKVLPGDNANEKQLFVMGVRENSGKLMVVKLRLSKQTTKNGDAYSIKVAYRGALKDPWSYYPKALAYIDNKFAVVGQRYLRGKVDYKKDSVRFGKPALQGFVVFIDSASGKFKVHGHNDKDEGGKKKDGLSIYHWWTRKLTEYHDVQVIGDSLVVVGRLYKSIDRTDISRFHKVTGTDPIPLIASWNPDARKMEMITTPEDEGEGYYYRRFTSQKVGSETYVALSLEHSGKGEDKRNASILVSSIKDSDVSTPWGRRRKFQLADKDIDDILLFDSGKRLQLAATSFNKTSTFRLFELDSDVTSAHRFFEQSPGSKRSTVHVKRISILEGGLLISGSLNLPNNGGTRGLAFTTDWQGKRFTK